MLFLLLPVAVALAFAAFAIGNMLGAMVLRARGFGLISFSKTAAPGRWRAPVARLAGPLLLYLVAAGIWAILFRYPEHVTTRLDVMRGHSAAAAGLQTGDVVVELDGAPVDNFGQIEARLKEGKPGQELQVVVLRGKERVSAHPALDGDGRLGVFPFGEILVHSWLEGLGRALGMPANALVLPVKVLLGPSRKEKPLAAPLPLPKGSALVEQRGAQLAPILVSNIWALLFVLAILSQVVAWARGELRAPAKAGS